MEKCSGALTLPLTELSPATGENRSKSSSTERERREKISDMYSALQSIVPNLLPKASRELIVAGTTDYIKSLERERERLETIKKCLPPRLPLRPPQSRSSSALEVTVSGHGVVFFGVRLLFRHHLVTEVFRVFERHRAEVLAANVTMEQSGDGGKVLVVAVTAAVGGGNRVEMIRRDLINL